MTAPNRPADERTLKCPHCSRVYGYYNPLRFVMTQSESHEAEVARFVKPAQFQCISCGHTIRWRPIPQIES